MNRVEMTNSAVAALRKKGFQITTFLDSNTCFDIIAKKGESTILIKVYENIDSIRKEQALELHKLSQVLEASGLIIGRKTKVFEMQGGTVYFRYDIPTITIGTFEKLLDDETPSVKYFKGKYIVDIDFDALRKKRGEMNLSLQELAEKIGVSGESMYRFEKGASTSAQTAKRLEKELDEDFTKKIPVFGYRPQRKKIDEVPDEKLLEKVHELGVKMALFEHAPFNAFGEMEKGMLISMGKGKFDIPKKAMELKKTSAVIESDSIIVTKEYKYKSVEGIPVIEEADLQTINKIKELRKLINEREKK
ncbi:MAG TPA: helix-turn-helix domain-containing protein [archaeon]|nr:helix-turn-helix domain-containing protein [archaeon]